MSEYLSTQPTQTTAEPAEDRAASESSAARTGASSGSAGGGFFARSALAGAQGGVPPITRTAPEGAQQGGLLDFFAKLFGRQTGQSDESQLTAPLVSAPQSAMSDQSPAALAAREMRRQAAATPGQISAGDPQYVSEGPPEGNPLSDFAQNTAESVEAPPYFETHAYRHSGTLLHSYVGLRYTVFNQDSNRYERKRIKAGFGCAWKVPFGPSRLMNDASSDSQAATESPISVDTLDRMFRLIPEDQRSHNYGVVHSNCNHFTKRMAQAAGANAAFELHDQGISPTTARNQMLAHAEDDPGTMGGTRIIYASGRRPALDHYNALLHAAADNDNCADVMQGPINELVNLLRTHQDMFQSLLPPSSPLLGEMPAAIAAITASTERLLHTRARKRHPNVNRVALQLLAEMRSQSTKCELILRQRGDPQLYDREREAVFGQRGEKERAAGGGAVSNADFYSSRNIVEQKALGKALLDALHAPSWSVLARVQSGQEVFEAFHRVISNNIAGTRPLLQQLLLARRNLTDSQLADLVLQAYFDRINTNFLSESALPQFDAAQARHRMLSSRAEDGRTDGWEQAKDTFLASPNGQAMSEADISALDSRHALTTLFTQQFAALRAGLSTTSDAPQPAVPVAAAPTAAVDRAIAAGQAELRGDTSGAQTDDEPEAAPVPEAGDQGEST